MGFGVGIQRHFQLALSAAAPTPSRSESRCDRDMDAVVTLGASVLPSADDQRGGFERAGAGALRGSGQQRRVLSGDVEFFDSRTASSGGANRRAAP